MKPIFLKLWFTTMLFTLCGLVVYAQTTADSIDISKYEQYIEDDGNLLDASGIIKPLGIFTTENISREVVDSFLRREGYEGRISEQSAGIRSHFNYQLSEKNGEFTKYCINLNPNSKHKNPTLPIYGIGWTIGFSDSKIYGMSLDLSLCRDSKGKSISKKKIVKLLVNYYKEKGAEVRKYNRKNTFNKRMYDHKGYELVYKGHYMRMKYEWGGIPFVFIQILHNCNEFYKDPILL